MTRRPATRDVLPGPRPVPLLGWRGNWLTFVRDPIAYAARLFERFGDLAALGNGDNSLIFVLGAGYNRALLERPELYRSALGPAAAPASAGLKAALRAAVDPDGGHWVRTYYGIVAQTTRQACQGWGVGQQLDAAWAMQRLSVRIAARALWGLERAEDIAMLFQATEHLHAASPARMVIGATMDVPGTPFRSVAGFARRVQHSVTASYKAARARGETPFASDSLLALLLDSAPEADVVELLAQQFAAGFPSVAAALQWTLFLLTQHTVLQAELHAEARRAGADAAPEEWLVRGPQAGNVVLESLRLFPPCAFGLRVLAQPATLGGYALPAGATVVYSPYLTHRLPERYFWPHRFRPERWLHVEPAAGEFLPFGGAPRAMLGAELAMFEIRIVLAVLLRRFAFGLAPGARIDRSVRFALMPRNGLPLVVSPPDRPVRRREPHGDVLGMVEL